MNAKIGLVGSFTKDQDVGKTRDYDNQMKIEGDRMLFPEFAMMIETNTEIIIDKIVACSVSDAIALLVSRHGIENVVSFKARVFNTVSVRMGISKHIA